MTRYNKAFTLAEVLITLGIIGIVAALTMPTLVSNHRKQEVVTKLEKVYSVMNQALKMSEAENGDVQYWIRDCGKSSAPECTVDETLEWFNTYIGKYLKYTKIKKNDDGKSFYVYFADGSILQVQNYIYDIGFYLNEKALTNPINGYNSFAFRFNPIYLKHQFTETGITKYVIKKTIEPNTYSWDGTREALVNATNGYACNKETPSKAYCAKLIQYEGWKIPDDYPIKF